jgi:hypothetical protein
MSDETQVEGSESESGEASEAKAKRARQPQIRRVFEVTEDNSHRLVEGQPEDGFASQSAADQFIKANGTDGGRYAVGMIQKPRLLKKRVVEKVDAAFE